MEDLQQAQILDSCRLALPEGLKELMSDISREVLRARPHNLYQFIADYLSAMLEARDKLHTAVELYKDICNADCSPELDEELKNIGLTADEAEEAKKVIIKYLEKDKVKEETLLAKLLKINIQEKMLPAIQNAVRTAFKRNQMKRRSLGDLFSNGDDTSTAAEHTLKLYWKSKHAEKQSFPDPDEGQTPYWDSDYVDHEINHEVTKTSTSDSSNDILKNIKYEGDIQDLYVSKNCKPYMNSSLIPLTGSYETIHKTGEHEPNVPEEENMFVNYDDDDEDLLTKKQISFKLAPKKVHTQAHRIENDLGKTENVNEINNLDTFNDINDEAKRDKKDFVYIDNVEDEAVIAEDESDVSINEELNQETKDV